MPIAFHCHSAGGGGSSRVVRPAPVSCSFKGLEFFKRVACFYIFLCQPVAAMFTTLATSNIRLFGYHQVTLSSYAQSNGPLYIHTPFTPSTPHHTHHIVGVPARINLNVDAAIEPVTSQVGAWHFPSHVLKALPFRGPIQSIGKVI